MCSSDLGGRGGRRVEGEVGREVGERKGEREVERLETDR